MENREITIREVLKDVDISVGWCHAIGNETCLEIAKLNAVKRPQ